MKRKIFAAGTATLLLLGACSSQAPGYNTDVAESPVSIERPETSANQPSPSPKQETALDEGPRDLTAEELAFLEMVEPSLFNWKDMTIQHARDFVLNSPESNDRWEVWNAWSYRMHTMGLAPSEEELILQNNLLARGMNETSLDSDILLDIIHHNFRDGEDAVMQLIFKEAGKDLER
ncbi:MAG: hypothetical protein FWE31_04320 [Firmicutes bacterium]|nr:hypothetical protein [Bacillota bacterium]